MTNTTSQNAAATREIDIANLDQVVGGAVMVPDLARKQEQEDKLTAEELQK